MRRLHLWLTIAWAVFAPIAIWSPALRNSVPLLVGISVYANIVGHWSAFQAARAEENSPDA